MDKYYNFLKDKARRQSERRTFPWSWFAGFRNISNATFKTSLTPTCVRWLAIQKETKRAEAMHQRSLVPSRRLPSGRNGRPRQHGIQCHIPFLPGPRNIRLLTRVQSRLSQAFSRTIAKANLSWHLAHGRQGITLTPWKQSRPLPTINRYQPNHHPPQPLHHSCLSSLYLPLPSLFHPSLPHYSSTTAHSFFRISICLCQKTHHSCFIYLNPLHTSPHPHPLSRYMALLLMSARGGRGRVRRTPRFAIWGIAGISGRTHQHSRSGFLCHRWLLLKLEGLYLKAHLLQMERSSQDRFRTASGERKHRPRSLDKHHPKYTLLFGERSEPRDSLIGAASLFPFFFFPVNALHWQVTVNSFSVWTEAKTKNNHVSTRNVCTADSQSTN